MKGRLKTIKLIGTLEIIVIPEHCSYIITISIKLA